MIGQAHVEQNRIGQEFSRQVITFVRTMSDQALVTEFVSKVVKDVGEIRFVFHHQNAAGGKWCAAAVIGETRNADRRHRRHRDRCHCNWGRGLWRRREGQRFTRRVTRFLILQRQHQSEHAALPRRTADADRTTEQERQIAGNRQTEPGSAVLAIGGAIGLAERFEDAFLLIRCDADPRITHNEGYTVIRLAVMVKLTVPCSVNFTAFDSRFFNTCSRR
jgi:hypothetical protein